MPAFPLIMAIGRSLALTMKMLMRSSVVGMIAAIAFGILAFALAPLFDAVGMYVMPSGILISVVGPLIDRLIPPKVMDWFIPDGGAAAGVLLISVCTLLFWTIVYGVTYFVSATMRRRRAIGQ